MFFNTTIKLDSSFYTLKSAEMQNDRVWEVQSFVHLGLYISYVYVWVGIYYGGWLVGWVGWLRACVGGL